MSVRTKEEIRQRLHERIRKKIRGTQARPRLAVHRSGAHIYAQVIDDDAGRTLCAASSRDKDVRARHKSGGNVAAAKEVGGLVASRAKQKGIELVAEEHDSEVYVRVRDDGRGLGEPDPEKLFELFYRSDAARAVPGGAGIGLFVCRNLIEAMGGRIWATDRPSGGAEFGFTLPIVESDL